jgi:hypothetical protein
MNKQSDESEAVFALLGLLASKLSKVSGSSEDLEAEFVEQLLYLYIDSEKWAELDAEVAKMKAEGKDVAKLEELISLLDKSWDQYGCPPEAKDMTKMLKSIHSIANRRRP